MTDNDLTQYVADHMKMALLDPPEDGYVAVIILADTEERATMTLPLDAEQFENIKLGIANMEVADR